MEKYDRITVVLIEWFSLFQSPSPRACHTLSRVNDKLYLFGGYDGQKCFNDIDVFDLDTFSWIQPKVSGTEPQVRRQTKFIAIRVYTG